MGNTIYGIIAGVVIGHLVVIGCFVKIGFSMWGLYQILKLTGQKLRRNEFLLTT